MNASILMISRKILQAADIPETSPTATMSSDADDGTPYNPAGRFAAIVTLLVVTSIGSLFCLGLCCFTVSFSRSEDDSPSDRQRRRSAVNSLPLIPYGRTARQRITTDDCPICLSEFREAECVKLIPYCGHVFHPGCLDTWLESHVTCPVCRSEELFRRGEEVCLDVAPEGSTAESGDTWRHEGVRRTCSCSNLPNRTVLQRSANF